MLRGAGSYFAAGDVVQRQVEHRPDAALDWSPPQAPSIHQHEQIVCEPAFEAEH
jgi:hypothetical protein